ncbi:SGM_3592 family protein [Streptomyces sennicomposti]
MAGATPGGEERDEGAPGTDGTCADGTVPGAGAGDGWDDVVLDADFIRAAATAEPSARARMLAARWRREQPEPQPWRSDEPPAGWFFGKARRRRWRRR